MSKIEASTDRPPTAAQLLMAANDLEKVAREQRNKQRSEALTATAAWLRSVLPMHRRAPARGAEATASGAAAVTGAQLLVAREALDRMAQARSAMDDARTVTSAWLNRFQRALDASDVAGVMGQARAEVAVAEVLRLGVSARVVMEEGVAAVKAACEELGGAADPLEALLAELQSGKLSKSVIAVLRALIRIGADDCDLGGSYDDGYPRRHPGFAIRAYLTLAEVAALPAGTPKPRQDQALIRAAGELARILVQWREQLVVDHAGGDDTVLADGTTIAEIAAAADAFVSSLWARAPKAENEQQHPLDQSGVLPQLGLSAPSEFDRGLFETCLEVISANPANRVGTGAADELAWPAVWAVVNACRKGRRAQVIAQLMAEAKSNAAGLTGYSATAALRLLGLAAGLFEEPSLADDGEQYEIFGMARWHAEDDTAAPAALLEAAAWFAMERGERDQSAGDSHLARAARLLVVAAHERVESQRGPESQLLARARAAAEAVSSRIVRALTGAPGSASETAAPMAGFAPLRAEHCLAG